MKNVLHYFVLLLALTLVGIISCQAIKNHKPLDAHQTTRILADFRAKTSPDKKLKMLNGLLNAKDSNSCDTYYFLLTKADESDLIVFKKAFASSGSLNALLRIGHYTNKTMVDFSKSYEKTRPDANITEKQIAFSAHIQSFSRGLNALAPEIKSVAQKNSGQLIAIMKKIYFGDDTSRINEANGPMIGLQAMGEEGFELLLNSIEGKNDQDMIFDLSEFFGPSAVIPTLKAFENPASSEIKKKTASLIIFSFSKTDPLVIDKIVEALKHGRYFEIAGKRNQSGKIVISSINESMKIAMSWWGNYLESYYKGESAVAEYIAKTYLKESDGQDVIIRLVTEMDFQTAKPYLLELDLNILSKKSLEALFHVCRAPQLTYSLGRKTNPYLDDRCDLFCRIFLKCDKQKRKKALYGVNEYPAKMMADFYIKNFASFSNEEKMTVIFNCGRKSLLDGFPKNQRDLVFEKIRPMCNAEQKSIIQYYLEKGSLY